MRRKSTNLTEIIENFVLEGKLKINWFETSSNEQGTFH